VRAAARSRARSRAAALGVFAVGLLLLLSVWVGWGALRPSSFFDRDGSSESMVQTVSVLDLRESYAETLLVLHIQPPLLDGLRGLLAQLWPHAEGRELVADVDRALALIWAVFYALIGATVCLWLDHLLRSTGIAVLAALGFVLHPAAIYYATFLEGTLLTAFGVLWLCFSLWSMPGRGSTVSLIGAYVFLFLLRSVFQWPALAVVVAALALRRVAGRQILVFATTAALVVGAFMLKQYAVFGWTQTSSFVGSNCLSSLGETPRAEATPAATVSLGPLLSNRPPRDYPGALTRWRKVTGAFNHNHVSELGHQRRLLRRCMERLASTPISQTLGAYVENASVFLRPSSRYLWSHRLVDRLPWRGAYDWVFSGPRLVLLLVAAAAWWMKGRDRSGIEKGLGLALPVLFAAGVCVVGERGENMRFKFFIEPVLYVFLVTQLVSFAREVRQRLHRG
jgi:hypothetical protein